MATKGLMSNYAPLPVTFETGKGVWLFDTEGNRYLDALTGIAVCGLGHCHDAVTHAITAQASQLVHTSNLYQIGQQEKLGKKLSEVAEMDACFFSNSGAEANECAIKLARLHGHKRGIEKPTIIVTEGAFHGRTMATLTATAGRKVKAGFEPLVQGFVRAAYNDLESIKTIALNNNNIVAIMVEPVQGEGGINVPDANYLNQLRELCDANEWLLILDEIQTGNGRTGKYFAYQHTSIYPDIVTTAKGLGNGMPIGACLAKGKAAQLFQPGNHGSTYGGNPLACATALAVIDTLLGDNLLPRASELGERMLNGFKAELKGHPMVADIRGQGLLLGIELKKPCSELMQQALEQQLLINVTADKVIRLLPALTMTDEEADQIVRQVCQLITTWGQHQQDD